MECSFSANENAYPAPQIIFDEIGFSLLKIECWKIFGSNTENLVLKNMINIWKRTIFLFSFMGNVSINDKLKTNLFFFFFFPSFPMKSKWYFLFNYSSFRNANIETLQPADCISFQKHKVNECSENHQKLVSLKEPQIHLLDYLLNDSQEGERLNYLHSRK